MGVADDDRHPNGAGVGGRGVGGTPRPRQQGHEGRQHSSSNMHTYSAGEDGGRLASAAASLGLDSHRRPRRWRQRQAATATAVAVAEDAPPAVSAMPTTAAAATPHHHNIVDFGHRLLRDVGVLFSDTTLESARMHSVGVTAGGEVVTGDGRILIRSPSEMVREKDDGRPRHPPAGLDGIFEVPPTGDGEGGEAGSGDGGGVGYGGTLGAAVFGIIKGMVGPCILYLPKGFELSGYLFAVPVLTVATAMYLFSADRLLHCWRVESSGGGSSSYPRREGGGPKAARAYRVGAGDEEMVALLEDRLENGGSGGAPHPLTTSDGDTAPPSSDASASSPPSCRGADDTYGAIAADENGASDDAAAANDASERPNHNLLSYPELARRAFGPRGERAVSDGIALMQFGVCLTYLIFVPQNLHESVRVLFGVDAPMAFFLVLMVMVEVPLSWIRDIRRLTTTNILATLLIFYGLVSCLCFALFGSDANGDQSSLFDKISRLRPLNDTWYLFIGTSVLVFEGSITLLVPLQEAVHSRRDRARFPAVYKRVILSIIAFYLFFAVMCWASFGDGVRTVLTTSLPDGVPATLVQFAYSVAVIFTFPLQNFPALEIVSRATSECGATAGKKSRTLHRNLITSTMVCLLAVIAFIAIDNLGNVVSLMGSLLGCPIAFVFPPLIHNRLVKGNTSLTKFLNNAVASVGVVAMVAASISTITSWKQGVGS